MKIGEQTLPQPSQQSHANTTFIAFARPWSSHQGANRPLILDLLFYPIGFAVW